MSAFEVSKAHIDVLINAGLHQRPGHTVRLSWQYGNPGRSGELTGGTAADVGGMLQRMNYASVDYTYRQNGHPNGSGDYPLPYRPALTPSALAPVAVLKALQCYEYNSDDHPTWEGSEAQAFCRALRTRVIESMPGYDAAPWAVSDLREVYAA